MEAVNPQVAARKYKEIVDPLIAIHSTPVALRQGLVGILLQDEGLEETAGHDTGVRARREAAFLLTLDNIIGA